jgi:F5/8 type C domain-containing protein
MPAPVVVARPRPGPRSWRWLAILVPILVLAGLAGFAGAVLLRGGLSGPRATASPTAASNAPTQAVASTAPAPHQIKPKSAAASSQLGEAYTPRKAIDNDPKTSWQEGVDGSVKGQWLDITFAKPADLTSIMIRAGNQRSDEHYRSNLRPHNITIKADNGKAQPFELTDINGEQAIAFSGHVEKKVRITLIDVYPAQPTELNKGTPWQDCPISELRFFGTNP